MAANTRLNDADRLALANGWAALDLLMREIVEQFKNDLCTTLPTETKNVLVNHQCYVAAQSFYVHMAKRVKEEVTGHAALPLTMPDVTEVMFQ